MHIITCSCTHTHNYMYTQHYVTQVFALTFLLQLQPIESPESLVRILSAIPSGRCVRDYRVSAALSRESRLNVRALLRVAFFIEHLIHVHRSLTPHLFGRYKVARNKTAFIRRYTPHLLCQSLFSILVTAVMWYFVPALISNILLRCSHFFL